MITQRIVRLLFFIVFVTVSSCVKDSEVQRPCSDIGFERLYALIGGNNVKVSYSHYVLISGYSGRCFNHTDFYRIAEGYIDSCKTALPIDEVRFMKSGDGMGFDDSELDMVKIDEGMIMGFLVSSHKIIAAEIVQDGVIKQVYISDCNWTER